MDIQMCKPGENEKAGKMITEKEEIKKTEFDIKNGRSERETFECDGCAILA